VNKKNVLIGSRLWSQKVGRISNAGFKQSIMNKPVFLGREDMGADGKVIFVAVDELEGEHGKIRRWPIAVGELTLPC
jgi:hypothetical protein